MGVPSTPPTRIDGTDGEIGYSQCQSPGAPPFGVELCLFPPHHAIITITYFDKIVNAIWSLLETDFCDQTHAT